MKRLAIAGLALTLSGCAGGFLQTKNQADQQALDASKIVAQTALDLANQNCPTACEALMNYLKEKVGQ